MTMNSTKRRSELSYTLRLGEAMPRHGKYQQTAASCYLGTGFDSRVRQIAHGLLGSTRWTI